MAKGVTSGDVINAGAGVFSLVKGLTAKKPGRFKPTHYKAVVRPAAGNEEALIRQKNEIAQQVGSATSDVNRIAGADVGQAIAARLAVQNNAQNAVINAEANNEKLLREDQIRQANEMNQEGQINAQYANQADQINYQTDQNNYQQVQEQARAGVNSALNYVVQKDANMRNNQIAERNAQQQINAVRGASYNDAYTKAIVAGKSAEEAKKIAEEAAAGFEPLTTMYKPKKK